MNGALETCATCKDQQHVDERGRIPQHDRVIVWAGDPPSPRLRDQGCRGVGNPSREELERRDAKGLGLAVAAAEALRAEATVALDAFLEGRTDFQFRFAEYRRCAMNLLRRQRKIAEKDPWRFTFHGDTNDIFWRRTTAKMDARCSFCEEVLMENTNRQGADFSVGSPGWKHVTRCILMFLAEISTDHTQEPT